MSRPLHRAKPTSLACERVALNLTKNNLDDLNGLTHQGSTLNMLHTANIATPISMKYSTVMFSSETAYVIACVFLFSLGHSIGGSICLLLAFVSSARERKEREARERAHVPSDERGERMELPAIVTPSRDSPAPAAGDAWTHEAKR